MVVGDAAGNTNEDDATQGLAEGRITRGELARNARNILNVLRKSPAGSRVVEGEDDITEQNRPAAEEKNRSATNAILDMVICNCQKCIYYI